MRNLTMLTDLYELTMMYGYYHAGMRDNVATFDMFFRSRDESTRYAVFAGLEQLIDYVSGLRFTQEDIARYQRIIENSANLIIEFAKDGGFQNASGF